MDHLQTRLEVLEQRTHTVERQLRWWRGLACGLAVLGLLGWGLPLGLAREDASDKDKGEKGLAQRVAALEDLLKHFSREKNDIFITGANLHIVNGLGETDCITEDGEAIPDCPNGLGNLIVGYNEPRGFEEDIRTGSHNVVVGQQHSFSRFGGLVVGSQNTISGDFTVVSGGLDNTASGLGAAVSGGVGNTASGVFASIIGGGANTASGESASVSGGLANRATFLYAAVSGGRGNTASNDGAVVSGGTFNTASSSEAVVSGGLDNTANGQYSSVSGGFERTAPGEFDWVAGSLFEDF
jgi:hypothetical protein